MPNILTVVPCQKHGCPNETVIPFSIPLRTRQRPDRSANGDPYIDAACPVCKNVFRYTPDMLHRRVYDTVAPDRLPAQTVWIGMWLKCDKENCASHVLVESVMVENSDGQDVKEFAAQLGVDDEVVCYGDHSVRLPIQLLWDSISDLERPLSSASL